MAKKTMFTEAVTLPAPFAEARVSGNTVQGVSLLGAKSSNGRVYTRKAMEDAAKLYAGVQVFANHPSHRDLTGTGGRRFEDLAGKITRAWVSGDRVKGDIQLLSGEPVAEKILTIAQEAPNLAGFSHRASGQSSMAEDGTQVVERINEVHALEVVVDPATVGGLFESKERKMAKRKTETMDKPMDVTAEVVEAAASSLFATPLGANLSKVGTKAVTDEVVRKAAERLFI